MLTAERRQAILHLLRESGVVRVPELSHRFHVSESTIRRDLEYLAEQGWARRTYGGAVAVRNGEKPPPPQTGDAEAEAIGRTAASLIRPGETIFLGAGPLIEALIPHLAEAQDLTVVTNGLETAHRLARETPVTLIVAGGQVERPAMALTGHLTEAALTELRADKVFLEVDGISPLEGVTVEDLHQASVVRTLLNLPAEVTVLVRAERLGRVGPAWVAPVDAVDQLVTGRAAPTAVLWDLSEQGLRIVLA